MLPVRVGVDLTPLSENPYLPRRVASTGRGHWPTAWVIKGLSAPRLKNRHCMCSAMPIALTTVADAAVGLPAGTLTNKGG
jgi:hypothetical protein